MNAPPGYVSLPVAATRLNQNYRTVRELVRAGVIRGERIGHERHCFVNEADLTRYLATRVAGKLAVLVPPPAVKEPSA
jgi:excisionase family DNA binding protein